MTTDIKTYTVDELALWLENKPLASHFVDVRDHDELLKQGVIHGYDLNIPYSLTNTDPELFKKEFSTLDKEKQLAVCCRSGRRGLLTAKYVVENLGFKDVYNVEGGILEWIEHGYPVEDISNKSQ